MASKHLEITYGDVRQLLLKRDRSRFQQHLELSMASGQAGLSEK
jgi:hypothetical protein